MTSINIYFCLTGPNAVEFIINHAEVSIAFVQENKIPSVCSSSFFELKFSLLQDETS
jgi:long-chain acyl-CoA synthetase